MEGSWGDHGPAFCLAALKEKRFLLFPRFQEGEASCEGLRQALRKNLFKEDAKEGSIQRLFYLPRLGMANAQPMYHHYPSQAHSRVLIIELNHQAKIRMQLQQPRPIYLLSLVLPSSHCPFTYQVPQPQGVRMG